MLAASTLAGTTVLAEPTPSADPEPSVTRAAVPTLPVIDDAALLKLADADPEVIEIDDTAPAESASSVHISQDDLKYRSRTQVSDILRQVPGLMVSQHAGGGKSDQYFIRGFDADHGTDIAIYADGIPVNMPSHGHGQGYADTHFLIPETIESIDVHKGPYSARFATSTPRSDGAEDAGFDRRAHRVDRRRCAARRRAAIRQLQPARRRDGEPRAPRRRQDAARGAARRQRWPVREPAAVPPGERARQVEGQARARRASARDRLVLLDVGLA